MGGHSKKKHWRREGQTHMKLKSVFWEGVTSWRHQEPAETGANDGMTCNTA